MLDLSNIIPIQPPPVDNRDEIAKWLRSTLTIPVSLKEDCTWIELLEWFNGLYSVTIGAKASDTMFVVVPQRKVHVDVSDSCGAKIHRFSEYPQTEQLLLSVRPVRVMIEADDHVRLERK